MLIVHILPGKCNLVVCAILVKIMREIKLNEVCDPATLISVDLKTADKSHYSKIIPSRRNYICMKKLNSLE